MNSYLLRSSAAQCSSSKLDATLSARKRIPLYPGTIRTSCRRLRAEPNDNDTTPQTELDEEARLELLEASLRAKKGSKLAEGSRQRSTQASNGPRAEWKEGSLFPEGWDKMDPLEKATELYVGERGFLYWANQLAWYSIIGIGVAWVLFSHVAWDCKVTTLIAVGKTAGLLSKEAWSMR